MDEILLFDHPFELLTAGLETDLYFSENNIEMIRNSRNITAWISSGRSKHDRITRGYFYGGSTLIWIYHNSEIDNKNSKLYFTSMEL